ncbi:uncharacterized protein I206_102202 [Kwoniella pini CBS 10737]|uniref:Uncharacterized protein n=1 Tax=Kwoniella pini CBS 10737 TaxID=1296096 RepID=A0A1B9HST3_9TREE|nr:uncharacterized protein I206_07570 [Kwoniella pini CBS 10737]OCF46337.1 hypothetical protein I206_07570 [Kwoniella pini CBS 10737]
MPQQREESVDTALIFEGSSSVGSTPTNSFNPRYNVSPVHDFQPRTIPPINLNLLQLPFTPIQSNRPLSVSPEALHDVPTNQQMHSQRSELKRNNPDTNLFESDDESILDLDTEPEYAEGNIQTVFPENPSMKKTLAVKDKKASSGRQQLLAKGKVGRVTKVLRPLNNDNKASGKKASKSTIPIDPVLLDPLPSSPILSGNDSDNDDDDYRPSPIPSAWIAPKKLKLNRTRGKPYHAGKQEQNVKAQSKYRNKVKLRADMMRDCLKRIFAEPAKAKALRKIQADFLSAIKDVDSTWADENFPEKATNRKLAK